MINEETQEIFDFSLSATELVDLQCTRVVDKSSSFVHVHLERELAIKLSLSDSEEILQFNCCVSALFFDPKI